MPQIKNATPTVYNGVKYRSKLEARCAEMLDRAGIEYLYEPFTIELIPAFEYMGKKYRSWTYTPDFVIFDNTVILEIKGFKNADNYVNKRKAILYRLLNNEYPYEFYEIYSETQLKGVLNIYNGHQVSSFYEAYLEYDKLRQEKHKELLKKRKARKK